MIVTEYHIIISYILGLNQFYDLMTMFFINQQRKKRLPNWNTIWPDSSDCTTQLFFVDTVNSVSCTYLRLTSSFFVYRSRANKGRGFYSKILFWTLHNGAFCWISSIFYCLTISKSRMSPKIFPISPTLG